MTAPPPVHRPGRRRRILIGGAAVALIGLLVVFALVLSGIGRLSDLLRQGRPLESAQLADAVAELSGLPAAHYVGTISFGGQKTGLDVKVTSKGSASGTLTLDGHKIRLLTVGKHTFLKAKPAYWRQNGAPASLSKEYGKRWVKVSLGAPGFGLTEMLAPPDLAKWVGRFGRPSTDPTKKINGIEVRKVVTPFSAVYVTTAAPYRVVRIESPSGDTGLPGARTYAVGTVYSAVAGLFRPAGDPALFGLVIDVNAVSDDDARTHLRYLNLEVSKLKDAIDSSVRFSLEGGSRLSNCNNFGCTVTVTISTRVAVDSPHVKIGKIAANVVVNFRLNRIFVGSCTKRVTIPANGRVEVSCSVRYNAPTNRRHRVEAESAGYASAAVEAEIPAIAKALQAEQDALTTHFSDADLDMLAATLGLPPREGTATAGIAVDAKKKLLRRAISGQSDDTDRIKKINERLRKRIPGLGHAKSALAHHAEQKIAYWLFENQNVEEAHLIINNEDGPCGSRYGCVNVLPWLLGPNQRVIIHWRDKNGKWQHSQVFIGKEEEKEQS
ncbi:DddA-like double-stranded DNA deaminase toxin [Rhizohabitans arisaemae]|uniref:DddA-like double-stranded DNA deaminase toxin n=1 Tax=Rhizohabitans arisaemae TaxID=2720610 RepID=UPI0024B1E186|nr:DddA-like double-stranded DNA deaminase toxin [Rhizohabitans arisaemae]